MKKINFLFIFLLSGFLSMAQSDKDWDLLVIREDVVEPSATVSYEGALADITSFFKENNIQNANYLTQLQDNYHYTHIFKLGELDLLDKGLMAYVSAPNKQTELQLLLDNMNSNLVSSKMMVVKYMPGLSYVPNENNWLDKQPYRRWNYFYFFPGTEKDVEQVLLTWKTLYQSKGVKYGFRVFKGVVGTDNPVYILTTWAADPLAYQQNLQDNMKKLGDEGAKAWISMMGLVRDAETVEGWYLPQYSYIPAK